MKECGWIEKCYFHENSKQFVEIVDANRKQTLLFWCSMEVVFISFVKRGSDAFQDRQGVRQNAPMMKWPPRLYLDNSSLLFSISTITVRCSCVVLRDARKVFDEMH
ncbi:unnamed protein product [Camellia sinensis]